MIALKFNWIPNDRARLKGRGKKKKKKEEEKKKKTGVLDVIKFVILFAAILAKNVSSHGAKRHRLQADLLPGFFFLVCVTKGKEIYWGNILESRKIVDLQRERNIASDTAKRKFKR